MTADVRQQLTEALDEAERLARAATPGPWRDCGTIPGVEQAAEVEGHYIAEMQACGVREHGGRRRADALHIARWCPATVLRLVAFFRDLAERHHPYLDDLHSRVPIAKCFTDDEEWPCDDIEQAAKVWLGTREADR